VAPQITYKHIFDATSNGVIVTNTSGVVVYINEQAERILKLASKHSKGMELNKIAPALGDVMSRGLVSGEPILGHHIINDDYSVVTNVTLIKEANTIIGAVCNFQEMQLFEQSAKQLESYLLLNKQFKTIFKSVSDAIWVCDGQGFVIDINKASEKINDIKAEDVVGKKIEDLIATGMYDQSVTSQVLKTKQQVTIVQRIMKTGKDVLATGTPVFNEKGQISLVVVNSRDVTQLNKIQEELINSRLEAQKLKETLKELSFLELKDQKIIAESKIMHDLLKVAQKLANLDVSNILVLGESGVGKGLLAKFIHQNGKRCDQPFIQINCAALPESLLEPELFGYEKGAFTGAKEQGKIGLIELAQNGTLFLDEIGDLPLALQAKILKYLDDKEVLRVGGVKPIKTNCTVIAATNQDLRDLVKNGRFRGDLFYRLNAFTLKIPPFRDRLEDISALVHHFVKATNKEYRSEKKIGTAGLNAIKSYSFPGNVRELKNIIKNAVIMSDSNKIDAFIQEELSTSNQQKPLPLAHRQIFGQLEQQVNAFEKSILLEAKKRCKNTREMAGHLGINQATVVRKMKKHNIAPTN
jgi:PAS domain S-box-containing protein